LSELDFERAWLLKFSTCLEEITGENARKEIMRGSDDLSSQTNRQDVIAWSKGAMERLEALVDEESSKRIMTGCACRYPRSALRTAREGYAATGDLDLIHGMLQKQFEDFLKNTLALDGESIGEIVRRGWGLAGVKEGNTIIATKIPKSGNLVAYMQETHPEKKRQLYCHCPRIRDALKTSTAIPATYCYCGAGFYKGIWEEILQQPVDVDLLESVLKGDQVCKVAIYLP
jgi:hypothetical protein